MKRIMLVCAAGMSTSLLVQKMQAVAEEKGLEAEIFAVSATEADERLADPEQVDVLLLGPQVRYMQNEFETKLTIPVAVIDMRDYGTMNGEAVLKTALELMK
ncbi:PTS sugar transporter subunit IIB [Ligilactobacillus murinus]|uniref:PTS sugar transporter subunit IIB n=1 Tax=Ligilactobacillus murinus TaxID=1622 RepID=UPI00096E01B0|nr:PTS sugar transporter subunit IIB [Ligilactobacillus murinus]